MTAIALAVLLVFGLKLTLLNPQRILGTTGLSYSLITAAVPVGALLMLTTVIKQWSSVFTLLGAQAEHIDFSVPHLEKYKPKADEH